MRKARMPHYRIRAVYGEPVRYRSAKLRCGDHPPL